MKSIHFILFLPSKTLSKMMMWNKNISKNLAFLLIKNQTYVLPFFE
jgi:hypothetical protein